MNLFSHPVYGFWMVMVVVPAAFSLLWSVAVAAVLFRTPAGERLPTWSRWHPMVIWKTRKETFVMSPALKPRASDVLVALLVAVFTGTFLLAMALLFSLAYLVQLDLNRMSR